MCYVFYILINFMILFSFSVAMAQQLSAFVLIDDFSDGDMQCELPSKNSWYFYGFGNNGSQVTPKISEDNEYGKYLDCTFIVRQPSTINYPNFDIITLQTDTSWMDQLVAPILGIGFQYKATHSSSSGNILLLLWSTDVNDDFHFYFELEKTSTWKEARIPLASFKQMEGGKRVDSLNWRKIYGIEFRMVGGGSGIFALDNIAFLSDYGKMIKLTQIGIESRVLPMPIVRSPSNTIFDMRGRCIDSYSKSLNFGILLQSGISKAAADKYMLGKVILIPFHL